MRPGRCGRLAIAGQVLRHSRLGYGRFYRRRTRSRNSVAVMVPQAYTTWSARVALVLREPSSSVLRRIARTVFTLRLAF